MRILNLLLGLTQAQWHGRSEIGERAVHSIAPKELIGEIEVCHNVWEGDDSVATWTMKSIPYSNNFLIMFEKQIMFDQLQILTVNDEEDQTSYQNVCVFVNGEEVECTAADFEPSPGSVIEFTRGSLIENVRDVRVVFQNSFAGFAGLAIMYQERKPDCLSDGILLKSAGGADSSNSSDSDLILIYVANFEIATSITFDAALSDEHSERFGQLSSQIKTAFAAEFANEFSINVHSIEVSFKDPEKEAMNVLHLRDVTTALASVLVTASFDEKATFNKFQLVSDFRNAGERAAAKDDIFLRHPLPLVTMDQKRGCRVGFQVTTSANGTNSCIDVDECVDPSVCIAHSTCNNTVGSFECFCNDGYRRNAADECEDVDECLLGAHSCTNADEICDNTLGSYQCLCKDNYSILSRVGDCLTPRIWHGESEDATWKAGGGFRTKLDGTKLDFVNMFDDDLNTYWLGELDAMGQVTSKNSLTVTFRTKVVFVRVDLVTRPAQKQYIRGTYQNLCLSADSVQLFCTPSDFATDVKKTITLGSNEVAAQVISLDFQDGVPAQISDFKILFRGENECVKSTHNCGAHADCTDTIGSFTCKCSVGYGGDGYNCTDIDECADDSHQCTPNSNCVNTEGSYNCPCQTGFEPDVTGKLCVDIDECVTIGCGVNENCLNTMGSFECGCKNGYHQGQNGVCADINECEFYPCDEFETCLNLAGSFSCSCKTGFVSNSTKHDDTLISAHFEIQTTIPFENDLRKVDSSLFKAKRDEMEAIFSGEIANMESIDVSFKLLPLAMSFLARSQESVAKIVIKKKLTAAETAQKFKLVATFAAAGEAVIAKHQQIFRGKPYVKMGRNVLESTCKDINECASGEVFCPPGSWCSNSVGSYSCRCSTGYKLFASSYWNGCADEDECAENSHDCADFTICTNTMGSFQCSCQDGYQKVFGNERNCTDIDECLVGTANCPNAKCFNEIGSYRCDCDEGFTKVDGYDECQDVDECEIEGSCGELGSNCVNTVGGFKCGCVEGFEFYSNTDTYQHECRDIDECVGGLDNCHRDTTQCDNYPGFFNCSCLTGYDWKENSKTECEDINECDTIECPLGTDCFNTVGSYTCERPTPPPTEPPTLPPATTPPYVFNASAECDMSTYDPSANGLCIKCHTDRMFGVINDDKLNHKAIKERNFRELPIETQNARIADMLLIDGRKINECVNNWTFNNDTNIRGYQFEILLGDCGMQFGRRRWTNPETGEDSDYIQFRSNITFDEDPASDDSAVNLWYGQMGEFAFKCNYRTTAKTMDKEVQIVMIRTESEIEQFVDWDNQAKIDFYKDGSFTGDKIPTSGLTIGSRLYYEVSWAYTFGANFPVMFYVDDCCVKQMDDSDIFWIIEDTCLSKIVKTRLHSDLHSKTSVRYSYKSFSFAKGVSYRHNFKLKCTLKFCLEADVAAKRCGFHFDSQAVAAERCPARFQLPTLYQT